MSFVRPRAVPKWPIVNFQQAFAAIDPMSILIGLGGGAVAFFIIQKYILKKCLR